MFCSLCFLTSSLSAGSFKSLNTSHTQLTKHFCAQSSRCVTSSCSFISWFFLCCESWIYLCDTCRSDSCKNRYDLCFIQSRDIALNLISRENRERIRKIFLHHFLISLLWFHESYLSFKDWFYSIFRLFFFQNKIHFRLLIFSLHYWNLNLKKRKPAFFVLYSLNTNTLKAG